jgi:ankyrin repeat protein
MSELSNVNIKDYRKMTPLMYAAGENNYTLTKLLIEEGANINDQDDEGLSPIIWACQNILINPLQNLKIIKLLLEHGADPTLQEHHGNTVLHYAIEYDHMTEIIRLLIQYGTSKKNYRSDFLNIRNHEGITPLMVAALKNNLPVCELLINNGAKLACVDYDGYTVLHYCRSTNIKLKNYLKNTYEIHAVKRFSEYLFKKNHSNDIAKILKKFLY